MRELRLLLQFGAAMSPVAVLLYAIAVVGHG